MSDLGEYRVSWYATFFQEWINPLLTWNASDFGGIDEINVDASKVWVPDIVLYNRYWFELPYPVQEG